MASGSFASAGINSKRQRALPIPKGTVDMKAFTADSSIASDVIPSANYGDRNKGRLPDMIVLHYTGMPDVEGAIAQPLHARHRRLGALRCAGRRPHRAMRAGGQARLARRRVPLGGRGQTSIPARSASRSSIRGHDWGYPDFPLRQIAAVIALCRGIMLRRNVPSHRVLAHSDVAPSRKKDPGEKFPWHSLANSGVGHWVQPAPIVRRRVAETRLDQRRRRQHADGVCQIWLRHPGQRQI